MHPDRADMDEMLHLARQRIRKLGTACGRKADHVDHYIGPQRSNHATKPPRRILNIPVQHDPLDPVPSHMGRIGLRHPARDVGHRMPRLDQTRHQISAHMPSPANNHNLRHHVPHCRADTARSPRRPEYGILRGKGRGIRTGRRHEPGNHRGFGRRRHIAPSRNCAKYGGL